MAVGSVAADAAPMLPGQRDDRSPSSWSLSQHSAQGSLGSRSRKPCPLKQLHDGLLGATCGGSSGSLQNLAKAPETSQSDAALPARFLISSALHPAGSIWRRRLKQGSDLDGGSSRALDEDHSTCEGDLTDLDSMSILEKSVGSETPCRTRETSANDQRQLDLAAFSSSRDGLPLCYDAATLAPLWRNGRPLAPAATNDEEDDPAELLLETAALVPSSAAELPATLSSRGGGEEPASLPERYRYCLDDSANPRLFQPDPALEVYSLDRTAFGRGSNGEAEIGDPSRRPLWPVWFS